MFASLNAIYLKEAGRSSKHVEDYHPGNSRALEAVPRKVERGKSCGDDRFARLVSASENVGEWDLGVEEGEAELEEA